MNIKELLQYSSPNKIANIIKELSISEEKNSIIDLKSFLLVADDHTYEKFEIPQLACRGLLRKGKAGVEALVYALKEAPSSIYASTIIEYIWNASHGKYPSKPYLLIMPLHPKLDAPLTYETITEARKVFHDIVVESRSDNDLFYELMTFLFKGSFSNASSKENYDLFRDSVFEFFSEATIKLTRSIINDFNKLVNEIHEEEIYQKFLSQHPVLIDPIASVIIPKQKLGIEFITDFVIKRLDNEYLVVEIEKPQDRIFTENNDFTAKFNHAVGQIFDFQSWIEQHSEYARSLMPGLLSPKGLLIIGLRSKLTEKQIQKLNRLRINLNSIDILTFDDLVTKANNFYNNIHDNVSSLL